MYQQRVRQLKERRLYLRLTIEQLAHIIGVSDKILGKWERQDVIPNMQNFEAWCNALDVNIILSPQMSTVHNWQPTTELLKELKQQYKEVNYEYEISNFCDWYKSKGDQSADWDALFRMWVRRSLKFHRRPTQSHEESSKTLSTIAERLFANQNLRNKPPH